MRVIEERAKDCPIILVGTHLDAVTDEKANASMTELMTRFARFHIRQCVAVSTKTGRYMDKLKELVISMGMADPQLKQTYLQVLFFYIIFVD